MVEISPPDDDRAQLLLVGGVALALVIVGTVVLLNGMRFQDTIGSKGNEQALQDALRTEGMIQSDLGNLADEIRADAGLVNYGDQMARNVSTYGGYYSNLTFNDGIVYVNVSLNRTASKNGTRVQQRSNMSFTNYTDSPPPNYNSVCSGPLSPCTRSSPYSFEVARDVTDIRPFNITIDQFPCDASRSVADDHANLTIRVENSNNPGDWWELRLTGIRQGGGACDSAPASSRDVTRFVEVENDTEHLAVYKNPETGGPAWFPDDGEGVEINIREGAINGQQLSDIQFAEGVDRPWDISLQTVIDQTPPPATGNDVGAEGQFLLVSNSAYPPTNPDSEMDPNVTSVLAEPAVDMVYQRPELRYNATIYLNGSDQP